MSGTKKAWGLGINKVDALLLLLQMVGNVFHASVVLLAKAMGYPLLIFDISVAQPIASEKQMAKLSAMLCVRVLIIGVIESIL